jgi:hypothetical protein
VAKAVLFLASEESSYINAVELMLDGGQTGRSPRSPTSSRLTAENGYEGPTARRACMSHHFDTKLAREDPSLNLCDFYLLGPSGKTVMAMTVNPDVGLSAPDTLHTEGLYAFRFDLNGDATEEVTFKFRFDEPRHGGGIEHTHIQPFVVRRPTGDDALRGDAGESLIEGETGSIATNSELRSRMLGLLRSYLPQMLASAHS